MNKWKSPDWVHDTVEMLLENTFNGKAEVLATFVVQDRYIVTYKGKRRERHFILRSRVFISHIDYPLLEKLTQKQTYDNLTWRVNRIYPLCWKDNTTGYIIDVDVWLMEEVVQNG